MISLAQVLFELDTAVLKRIIEERSIDPRKLRAQDKKQLAHSLAVELSNPQVIVRALARCDARELRLLQLLLNGHSDGVTPTSRILSTAGSTALPAVLPGLVESLTHAGLAFTYGNGVYVSEAVRRQTPASVSDRYTLARSLEMYDAGSLKRIRDNLGLSREFASKAAMIDAISAALLGKGAQNEMDIAPGYVRDMPKFDREVLNYILNSGGAVAAANLAHDLFEGQASEDFFRYDWQNRWKTGRERNAVDRLLSHGLVFVVSSSYGYDYTVVIPSDLRVALSGAGNDADFWTAEPPRLQATTPPAMTTPQSDIIRDAVSLLAYVSSQDAARTSTGYMHKSALKSFARALLQGREDQAAFVYALCRQAGLIQPFGDKQSYAVTEEGYAWLEFSHEEQVASLYQAWLSMTIWAEMFSEPLQRDNEYRPADQVHDIRSAVIQCIRTADAPCWYALDSVLVWLNFNRPLSISRTFGLYDGLSPIAMVHRLILTSLCSLGCAEPGWALASEPAQNAPLGVASIQQNGQRFEAVSFRLTPAGRFLLGVAGAAPPEPYPQERAFILQANAEIFVPPYLAADLLYRLLTFTDPNQGAAAGNTVRITRESLRRALDHGQTVDEILAFLTEFGRTPIPQNVEYLIRETGGRHGSLRVGVAHLYIRAESQTLLQEMLARKDLKAYGIRAISDTVAILASGDLDRLLRDLRKAGYLPVSDNLSAPARPTTPTGIRIKPASEEPPAKPDKSVIHWDRIAKEDGRFWGNGEGQKQPSLSVSKPLEAVQALPLMRIVMTQAIKAQSTVEIAYRADNQTTATMLRIQPQIMMGDLITGINVETERLDTIDLTRAEWTRLIRA